MNYTLRKMILLSPARKDLSIVRVSCLFLLGGNIVIGLASTDIVMLLGEFLVPFEMGDRGREQMPPILRLVVVLMPWSQPRYIYVVPRLWLHTGIAQSHCAAGRTKSPQYDSHCCGGFGEYRYRHWWPVICVLLPSRTKSLEQRPRSRQGNLDWTPFCNSLCFPDDCSNNLVQNSDSVVCTTIWDSQILHRPWTIYLILLRQKHVGRA